MSFPKEDCKSKRTIEVETYKLYLQQTKSKSYVYKITKKGGDTGYYILKVPKKNKKKKLYPITKKEDLYKLGNAPQINKYKINCIILSSDQLSELHKIYESKDCEDKHKTHLRGLYVSKNNVIINVKPLQRGYGFTSYVRITGWSPKEGNIIFHIECEDGTNIYYTKPEKAGLIELRDSVNNLIMSEEFEEEIAVLQKKCIDKPAFLYCFRDPTRTPNDENPVYWRKYGIHTKGDACTKFIKDQYSSRHYPVDVVQILWMPFKKECIRTAEKNLFLKLKNFVYCKGRESWCQFPKDEWTEDEIDTHSRHIFKQIKELMEDKERSNEDKLMENNN